MATLGNIYHKTGQSENTFYIHLLCFCECFCENFLHLLHNGLGEMEEGKKYKF